MSLYRVNEILSEAVDVLCEMSVGQTIENNAIRAHRFAGSIRVTDMTNAGKRGKMVDEFSLYDTDFAKNPKLKKLIDQFASKLLRTKSYKMALKMAEGIAAEADRMGESNPKIEKSQHKGVRVAPGGFKKIEVNGPHVYIRADNSSFSVKDKGDMYNEPTCIAPVRAAKTAVKKFYAWAKANEKQLKSMTFKDVTKAMDKNKIDYHFFCAMD